MKYKKKIAKTNINLFYLVSNVCSEGIENKYKDRGSKTQVQNLTTMSNLKQVPKYTTKIYVKLYKTRLRDAKRKEEKHINFSLNEVSPFILDALHTTFRFGPFRS